MTFTYEKFEQNGVLTLLDPLFTLLLLFSALFLLAVLRFHINPKIMLFIAAFIVLLGAQLLSIEGILADELNLSGASKNLYLFIATTVVQLITVIYSFIKDKKTTKKNS